MPMELESLEYEVVMDAGGDTEVLARAKSLDIASAAYMAAVAEPGAIEAAVAMFALDDHKRRRLAVNPRR